MKKRPTTGGPSGNSIKSKTPALAFVLALSAFALVFPRPDGAAAAASFEVTTTTTAQRRPPRRAAPTQRARRRDYSKFSHRVAEHQRQACDACHKFPSPNWKEVRAGQEAFPDITQYPVHESCLDCHREQFFERRRPVPQICSVCHAVATPRNQTRHPFPNPPALYDKSPKGRADTSEFVVGFPHDKHLPLFSRLAPEHRNAGAQFVRASFARVGSLTKQADEQKTCANCHVTYQPQGDSEDEFVTKPPKDLAEGAYWLKKGTFKTSPRDHATCFTCHSADGQLAPAPHDCAACHKLPAAPRATSLAAAHGDYDPKIAAAMNITDKPTLEMWSRRGASRFRHEWPPHDLACSACHSTATMNTLDEASRKVKVQSCGGEGTGCHVEPAGDGALNLEVKQKQAAPGFQCTKCHVINGRLALPESHLGALAPTPAKKP